MISPSTKPLLSAPSALNQAGAAASASRAPLVHDVVCADVLRVSTGLFDHKADCWKSACFPGPGVVFYSSSIA